MNENPRLRASDSDREKAVAALNHAFTQGQLDYAEFDTRCRQVWGTTYRDELVAPLADLLPDPMAVFDRPLPAPVADTTPAPRPSAVSRQVTGESGGDALSFSVMGGSDRSGNWLCAPTHLTFTVMGGNVVDLRQARLAARETTITALAVMGGIEIVVPEDVRVISDGVGLMGGFGVNDDRSVTVRQEDLPADAPVIRVRGLALMGGVGVTRKARHAD